MRINPLFPLFAIGACARHETPPTPVVNESALMRFLRRPFGLGSDNPTIQDVSTRKPYSGRNDPLYLQTLNRSRARAREGTLPREEDSALVKFLKHPFGLGYKDPVDHIADPFRKHVKAPLDKHVKTPIQKSIKKLEKEDPLNLKSTSTRSLQHNIADPVRKNVVDPVKRGIVSAEDSIRELEKDDPYLYENAAQRQTVRDSPLVRFFKHPFGLGTRRDLQERVTEPVKEYIVDPLKEHVAEPIEEHVVEPIKDEIRKLEKEDPLNLKPLKRKVTKKLTNEGWARGRNPEEHEKFLEIEETLMGTD